MDCCEVCGEKLYGSDKTEMKEGMWICYKCFKSYLNNEIY